MGRFIRKNYLTRLRRHSGERQNPIDMNFCVADRIILNCCAINYISWILMVIRMTAYYRKKP